MNSFGNQGAEGSEAIVAAMVATESGPNVYHHHPLMRMRCQRGRCGTQRKRKTRKQRRGRSQSPGNSDGGRANSKHEQQRRSRDPTLARDSAGAFDKKGLPLYIWRALSRQCWCDAFLKQSTCKSGDGCPMAHLSEDAAQEVEESDKSYKDET